MRSAAKVLGSFASVWLLVMACVVYANGGGLHAKFFSSWWGEGKVPLKATVEYDATLLWSTSIGGKFRLLRAVLENAQDAPVVRFSKDADTFEVVLRNGNKVKGILDLRSSFDPRDWDALPPKVREALVYPTELKSNSARAVYIVVRVEDLVEEPAGFNYVIRSLPRSLRIEEKPATRA